MVRASHIAVHDIPTCISDLRDALSDYDREAAKAAGSAPDGVITEDDFAYLKAAHPKNLGRFSSLSHFKRFAEGYVDSNKFNPVCQEESGIAVNELPVDIRQIPGCVSFDGGISLYSAMQAMDARADGGTPDGRFTQANFDALKRSERDLTRFKTFGQFKKYIRQYIDSQRCTDECRAERMEQDDPEGDRICYAPAAPAVPDMPPPKRKKRPAAPAKDSQPEKIAAAYDLNYPSWLDDPASYDPKDNDGQPPPRYAGIPGMDELLAMVAQPVEMPAQTAPLGLRADRMDFRASFDGKNFIFDLHGCQVDSASDLSCRADWAYFMARLHNVVTGATGKSRADFQGMVRVTVPARIGDTVTAVGQDSMTLSYSLNKLRFKIEQDGSVSLIDNEIVNPDGTAWRPPTAEEKTSQVLNSLAPGLGPILGAAAWLGALMLDPKGTWDSYMKRADWANVNGWSGTVSDENNRLENGVAGSNLEMGP